MNSRTRAVALAAPFCMCMACLLGGYWYVHFYPAGRALILKGPWPFAHTLFMETKEHLFFATLILALYLPIAAAEKLYASAAARRMVLCVAALISLSGLAIEGAGAMPDFRLTVSCPTGQLLRSVSMPSVGP